MSGTTTADGRPDEPLTRVLSAAAAGVGVTFFGYSIAVQVGFLDLLWGPFGLFQYALLPTGALLATGGTVAWLVTRRERPVEPRVATIAGVLVVGVAVLATVLAYWAGGNRYELPPFIGWTVFGLLVLGLQFPLGTLVADRMWVVLLAEWGCAVAFLVVYFGIDGGLFTVVGHLLASVFLAGLLALFGWPLFGLGRRVGTDVRERCS